MRQRDGGTICTLMRNAVWAGVLAMVFTAARPALAVTDFIYFSVNGDTSLTSLTQGDDFSWTSNCASGGTVQWEIWYDVNTNAVIEPASDGLLGILNLTDGDLLSDDDGVVNGWVSGPLLTMFVEPGSYIFKATDLSDATSTQRVLTCSPMISPPNVLSGTIIVPGHTPPDVAVLGNKVIWAETDVNPDAVYTGVTDASGAYSMNIDAAATGATFLVGAPEITGFATPPPLNPVVSGATGNVDFTYGVSADSVYGFLKSPAGSVLSIRGGLFSDEQFPGTGEKEVVAEAGRYAIHYAAAELGDWGLELETDHYLPVYLVPNRLDFSHDTLGSFQHDFTLYPADAVVYARVTENGGLPANNYLVKASSDALSVWTRTASGTGTENVAALHVSSQDPSGWSVRIEMQDQDFPMPAGLIWDGVAPPGVAPGDTVTLNMINGHTVSDQIVQDPEDAPVVWDNVWVSLYQSDSKNYGAPVGPGGFYEVTVDTGDYTLNAWYPGYLFSPPWRSLRVTADTTGNLGFVMNKAHNRVTGTFVNVPTPLDGSFYWVSASTGVPGSGYEAYGSADSVSGTYEMYLCDGSWTIVPPTFPGFDTPAPAAVAIGEAPDTARVVDFVYTPTGGGCSVTKTGDVNNNGEIVASDIIYLVNYVLKAGPEPLPCPGAGDVNCNGAVVSADIIYLVNYVFRAGPLPCDVCSIVPGTWSCP